MSKKASGGPPRRRIGVFVVDDHEIVRRGVRDLLEAEPDIEVVGEASTASSALAQIPALRPSVAVLDACDALDGIKDGVVDNPKHCKFDPGVLLCKGADEVRALEMSSCKVSPA